VEVNTEGGKATAPSFGLAGLPRSRARRHPNRRSASAEGVGESRRASPRRAWARAFSGSVAAAARRFPRRVRQRRGAGSARSSVLGRDVPPAPASRKQRLLFFTFSSWCQGRGPAAGSALGPGCRRLPPRSRQRPWLPAARDGALPRDGVCPAQRERPPRSSLSAF